MHALRAKAALNAFFIHLMASALVALMASYFILKHWYPYPFDNLSGGKNLCWIMAVVNTVCGPLLTALSYNPRKTSKELIVDLLAIVLLQISALSYGIFSISQARPIILAFEVDRFTVVSLSQIHTEELNLATADFRSPAWTGPRLVGTRMPHSGDETLLSIELSLQGKEPSFRPDWWQDYEESRSLAKRQMKPLNRLRLHAKQNQQAIIDDAVRHLNSASTEIFYLPLTSQKITDQWIVLLNKEASIIGYANVDGFQ